MARQATAPSRVYTGAWRASKRYSDVALPPGPGVDPSHMRPDAADPGQIAAGYPRVDYAPLYVTQEPDDAWAHELDTPGLILDVEPITHDAGDLQPYHPAPIPGAQSLPPDVRAHMVSRGADLRGQHEEPQDRASDEEPRTERWEQAAIAIPSLTTMQRGTNSLDVNNPDGYRLGWSVKRFYHRRMAHERMMHTERALYPSGAARAVESPAMTARESNRYTSPFAWRSFSGSALLQMPLLRRDPPDAQSSDTVSDGTDSPSDIVGDWVVG
jgi:hypothetical protein